MIRQEPKILKIVKYLQDIYLRGHTLENPKKKKKVNRTEGPLSRFNNVITIRQEEMMIHHKGPHN